MKIEEIRSRLISDPDYQFLRKTPTIRGKIEILTLGGSHAYGMDKESSDVDIRGVARNSIHDLMLGRDFEQEVDEKTDTVIYSINKIFKLLTNNNPNVIEILGCKPEHYLVLGNIGQYILDKRKIFLSKLCIHTFNGYAMAQLRRLENKSLKNGDQTRYEEHILNSIKCAKYDFRTRYFNHDEDDVYLHIEKSDHPDYDSEIFMDINLKNYPLRDWAGMWNEMKSIVSSYNRMGKRNQKAIEHDKLGKHMAHLMRLYMMGIDILEKEEIITYRENEHDLLMSIRNGEFLDENDVPKPEFYDLLNDYSKRFEYAAKNTSLPDKPNYGAIDQLHYTINRMVVY